MIRHRVQDDGVLVTLKQSWGTAHATITESQAKRFAWGVLADLDPDGVERLAPLSGPRDAPRCGGRAAPRVRPQGSTTYSAACDEALIKLVKAGGLTMEQIGEAMTPKRTRGSIAGRVDRLRRKGKL